MCVSTVYKDKKEEKNILMKNVMDVESNNGVLTFTDIMERKINFKGTLLKADLVDGYLIVSEGK